MRRIIDRVLAFVSGEWILKWMISNGGNVIFLRSAWVTIFMLVLLTTFEVNFQEPYIFQAFFRTLGCMMQDHKEWFGAIFGASYASFYARFSSQWSYLAGVYNQIKQAEVNGINNWSALAEWRAGFIEDAMHLHLTTKVSIAPIIESWSKYPEVQKAFIENVPSGEMRWYSLIKSVNDSIRAED